MSLLTRAVGSARLSSSSSKRIVIRNTRLCLARKRTENDRFSHDGACYIVSFVVVFPVYMTMYTYVERIQNVCPKIDANDSVLCTICFSISLFIFQLCFFLASCGPESR